MLDVLALMMAPVVVPCCAGAVCMVLLKIVLVQPEVLRVPLVLRVLRELRVQRKVLWQRSEQPEVLRVQWTLKWPASVLPVLGTHCLLLLVVVVI